MWQKKESDVAKKEIHMLLRRSLLILTILFLSGCGFASTVAFEGATPTATVLPSPAPTEAPPAPTEAPTASVTPEPTAPPVAVDQPAPTPRVAPTITPVPVPTATPAPPAAAFSLPIGTPGQPLGDGFFVRHTYAAENTWFNPGYWHAGEDWYALEGETAGAAVYAIAAGEVVYVGSNYPGRVVIVQHAADLFSMYGHLDPAVAVQTGQTVARGDLLGVILRRSDSVPDHLHFEVRTFLTTTEVNGSAPRYGFRCGVNCPPGPGYWPINAPDLPDDLGWRNPTHVILGRAFPPDAVGDLGEVMVATQPVAESTPIWTAPPGGDAPPEVIGTLPLQPGARFALREIWTGAEEPRATSAESYQVWYRIGLPDGQEGWVAAATATTFETGSDGRPSTLRFNLLPATIVGNAATPAP